MRNWVVTVSHYEHSSNANPLDTRSNQSNWVPSLPVEQIGDSTRLPVGANAWFVSPLVSADSRLVLVLKPFSLGLVSPQPRHSWSCFCLSHYSLGEDFKNQASWPWCSVTIILQPTWLIFSKKHGGMYICPPIFLFLLFISWVTSLIQHNMMLWFYSSCQWQCSVASKTWSQQVGLDLVLKWSSLILISVFAWSLHPWSLWCVGLGLGGLV